MGYACFQNYVKFVSNSTNIKLWLTAQEANTRKQINRFCCPGSLYLSADMQVVVMMSRMPGYKTAIFTKRMVCFHETFAPIGTFTDRKPVGVVWNESITGRNATDVASTFVRFIRKESSTQGTLEFFIWLDNCSAQNKNWTLFKALVAEVNHSNGPRLITLKFFEPGHTFMSADAFHQIVEKHLKKEGDVCDFNAFVQIIKFKGEALELLASDFIEYPKGVSSGNDASNKPKMENIRIVQFRKGSDKMFWKESLEGKNFLSQAFLLKKVSREIVKGNIDFFQRKTKPRGLTTSKKADIISKMCPLMTNPENRAYWASLPESDAS